MSGWASVIRAINMIELIKLIRVIWAAWTAIAYQVAQQHMYAYATLLYSVLSSTLQIFKTF